MSNPPGPPAASIRVRRVLSLLLSCSSAVVALIVLAVFLGRNSTFLSDGILGLPLWLSRAVTSLPVLPLMALAALLLVCPLPPHGRVDRMPQRLPLVASLIALALVAACFVLPWALSMLSLMFALVSIGL